MKYRLIYENFNKKINQNKKKKISKLLKKINKNTWPEFLKSFKQNYKYSYGQNILKKYQRFKIVNIIGIGGSSLGAKAIYSFLKYKIKKKFNFVDSFSVKTNSDVKNLNVIISKSGKTLETVVNFNLNYSKKNKNIFITENKKNYLNNLANKLKSEVIEHKNFIGGRFSVLSEVGMLPAELMGLKEKKFKQFNNLITKKYFLNNLINNVISISDLIKNKKYNSVILNYDDSADDLFKWYQQLVSESLGKKSKGIIPIISSMPKDNHSLLQLYLSGFNKNFYTFFIVSEKNSMKIKNSLLLESYKFLKNKNVFQILNSQRIATQNIFKKKNIPFRSFYIKERNEETLGELFCFFTLEVILLSNLMNVNPLDQPQVELVKKETFNLLRK